MIEIGFSGRYLFSGHIYNEIWKYREISLGSRGKGSNAEWAQIFEKDKEGQFGWVDKKCGKRWA